MKICTKCKILKSKNDFNKHSCREDGFSAWCKLCCSISQKILYNKNIKNQEWKNNQNKRIRNLYYRLNYKDKYKKQGNHKNRKLYPEKYIAEKACVRIKKKKGCHNHHWSYNKEHIKDTIQLSIANHAKVHRYMKYDQERKQYRTIAGILIDSKEKAIQYYASLKNLE
jgi:hypothetical protein